MPLRKGALAIEEAYILMYIEGRSFITQSSPGLSLYKGLQHYLLCRREIASKRRINQQKPKDTSDATAYPEEAHESTGKGAFIEIK